MSKLKTGLVAATGLAVGILTLRAVRNRRRKPSEDVAASAEAVRSEVETATEHATAAAKHAGAAGKHAIQYAQEELAETNSADSSEK
jgi:hypothetical protein